MAGTMTFVGVDVHARSMHAAAIDVMSGELTRWRFRGDLETPVAWLRSWNSITGVWQWCAEVIPFICTAKASAVYGDQTLAPMIRTALLWSWAKCFPRELRAAIRRSVQ